MIVDHRNVRIHENLTPPDGEAELLINVYGVSSGEKVDNIFVFLLIEGLEERQLQPVDRGVVEFIEGRTVAVKVSSKLQEDVGLVHCFFRICGKGIWDNGDVCGSSSIFMRKHIRVCVQCVGTMT